jgi:hypothetical protein
VALQCVASNMDGMDLSKSRDLLKIVTSNSRQVDQAASMRLSTAFLLSLVIALLGAAAASGYTVSGDVTAQGTGSGLAETEVVARAAATGQEVASTSTSLDGEYELSLPEETFEFTFTPPKASGYNTLVDGGVRVSANTTLNAQLAPSGGSYSFAGVLRGEGGVALPDVSIVLGDVSEVTGSDGSFSFSVGAGTYEMKIEGDRPAGVGAGVAPYSFRFTGMHVKLEHDLHEDLVLPVHAVTLHAVGAGGEGVAGKLVGSLGTFVANDEVSPGGPSSSFAPGIEAGSAYIDDPQEESNAEGFVTVSVPDWVNPTGSAFEYEPSSEQVGDQPISLSHVSADEARVVPFGGAGRSSTEVVLSSAANPVKYEGSSGNLRATVKAVGGGATPMGTVTFTEGSTVLGTVALVYGTAKYPLSALAIGTHTIVASYNGNVGEAPSQSSPFTQTIT